MNSKDLYLKREAATPELISKCKQVLDQWSNTLPFCPIKNLGSVTELTSATEYATYKTVVTTQIEKRWIQDHETPFRDQGLPSIHVDTKHIDPWKENLPIFADFSPHTHSLDLPQTRKVHECEDCRATGIVRCPVCAGKREIMCSKCDGYGQVRCGGCSGKGQIQNYRKVPQTQKCRHCSGAGYDRSSQRRECSGCYGRGTEIVERVEEYYIPCGECAASGKLPCSRCRSSGKVTCPLCEGSGEITCPRCKGERKLLRYATVEKSEECLTSSTSYLQPDLPTFAKSTSPVSNLEGPVIFEQDEGSKIVEMEFEGCEASVVLLKTVEAARVAHAGHVVRQKVEISRCSIVQWSYKWGGQSHTIYINPLHELVEDISGPIHQAISRLDSEAEEAYKAHHYEHAFRTNLKSLCMDEATEPEISLRAKILESIRTRNYVLTVVGFIAAILLKAWFLRLGGPIPELSATAGNQIDDHIANVALGAFIFALIPIIMWSKIYSRISCLTLTGRTAKLAALLGGFTFCLAATNLISMILLNQRLSNWRAEVPTFYVQVGVFLLQCLAWVFASDLGIGSEKARLITNIESRTTEFATPGELEKFVQSAQPCSRKTLKVILPLTLLCLVSLVQSAILCYSTILRNNKIAPVATAHERKVAQAAGLVERASLRVSEALGGLMAGTESPKAKAIDVEPAVSKLDEEISAAAKIFASATISQDALDAASNALNNASRWIPIAKVHIQNRLSGKSTAEIARLSGPVPQSRSMPTITGRFTPPKQPGI